jgi:hypothetical protein
VRSSRWPVYKTLAEAQEAARQQKRDEALDELLAGTIRREPRLPEKRPPGRPPWTPELFQQRYDEAVGHCALGAKDQELADAMGYTLEHFRRLRRKFARPA